MNEHLGPIPRELERNRATDTGRRARHQSAVLALVRDEQHAGVVTDRGAEATVVDLYDRPAVAGVLSGADGAIHTASPGDETSADLDSAVADAALDAFAGTGRPYLHISGLWIYGDNTSVSEESPPLNPPAMVAWKVPIRTPDPGRPRDARSRDRRTPRMAMAAEGSRARFSTRPETTPGT